MKQTEIKALLKEASNTKCAAKRRDEICELLQSAAYQQPGEDKDFKGKENKAILRKAMVGCLFVTTCDNSPSTLPLLFPAFVIVCGDRRNVLSYASDIDWSLYL